MAIMDVIKYDASSTKEFVWKFPSESIRLGSQLIVNEAQEAIFVKGGKLYDRFGPGTHTLSTKNLPILASIISWPFGGRSPFAAEVWFISKVAKRDLPWGTKERITVTDSRYNLLVRMSAYGYWGFRIDDPVCFLTKIVGTLKEFNAQLIEDYFVAEILQKFSTIVARVLIQDKISFSEIAPKYNDISRDTIDAALIELNRFGLTIINFNISGIEAGDEEIQMIQQVQAKVFEMERFSEVKLTESGTTIKSLNILNDAVKKDGGVAGSVIAAGAAMGMAFGGAKNAGQQVGESMKTQPQKQSAETRFAEIKGLFDKGFISKDEYEKKRKEIIDGI